MDKQILFSIIDSMDFSKDPCVTFILKNGRRYYTSWNKLEKFRKTEDTTLEMDQMSGDHISLPFWMWKTYMINIEDVVEIEHNFNKYKLSIN